MIETEVATLMELAKSCELAAYAVLMARLGDPKARAAWDAARAKLETYARQFRRSNVCDDILSHKYLAPECVSDGCRNLFLEEVVAALTELVALKDIKDHYESMPEPQDMGELIIQQGIQREYMRRKGKAWEAARALRDRYRPLPKVGDVKPWVKDPSSEWPFYTQEDIDKLNKGSLGRDTEVKGDPFP